MGAISRHADKLPERHSGVFPIFRKSSPLASVPSDLLSAAKKCYLEKDYGQAESKLKEILSENSSDKEAIALLIRVYSKTDRFAEAKALFEESRKAGNADKTVYTAFIASCTHRKSKFEAYSIDGYNLIDEAKRTSNILPEAFASLISYYGKMGMMSLAESVFEKAHGYRDAGVYAAFIFACCRTGDPGKAERALDRAQNEGILDPQMFKNLVDHYSESRMTYDARRIFDWAIARDNMDSELCEMIVRGYLYHSPRDREKAQNARNIFDFAFERGLVTHYLCSLMETGYMDSGMPEKTAEIFFIARQLDIGDEELSSIVLRSYALVGKEKEANGLLSQNVNLPPANTNAFALDSNPHLRTA